ncbi:hypothetical protein [Bacillus sp. FJAT-29814]|uniref:hypothetical protein n=1 Tax=Bacillus sp. FJAT-29814 TaxID=1729688 RepID=UPI000836410A|nr:hypothetical protein [Bacillus sp. FJAT-29814]
MARLQPPHINGVMELTEEEQAEIKAKLVVIHDAFEETDEQPVCDTFYLTSTYNRENPEFPINGDTVESLLVEESPVEVGEE